VLSLAAVGNGCPDLLVNRAGIIYLLEVKDGNKFKSQQKLTSHQERFRVDWPVQVVNSIESALEAVGIMNTKDKPYSGKTVASSVFPIPEGWEDFKQSGPVMRTTFDPPITVTEDDELESYWQNGQMVTKKNGVIIPSKTEVVE
jgi:hypothetical protein